MSEALTVNQCTTLEQFAAVHGLSVQETIALLNDPDFIKGVQETAKAQARLAFYGKGVPKLIDMAGSDDDKTALSAITTLGKLAGEFKTPRPVQVSFDELIKKAAQASGPLAGITQITESTVIDAEEDNENDD